MHPKLKSWFETKGRQLVELKVKGGQEFFGSMTERDMSKLTSDEWMGFFTLTGQMDGLLWALQPDDPAEMKQFHQDVKEFFTDMEEECRAIEKLTGKTSIPKGRA